MHTPFYTDGMIRMLGCMSSQLVIQCWLCCGQQPASYWPNGKIVTSVHKVSYLVDMNDNRKRRRILNVNMLKEFRARQPVENSYWADETLSGDNGYGNSDVPLWNKAAAHCW